MSKQSLIQELVLWYLKKKNQTTLKQQQQQHTLLTFPKGAFQRQCYKNNPITIKNPIYN